ncbi:MAG: CapA family protein [Clostridia bacterium]
MKNIKIYLLAISIFILAGCSAQTVDAPEVDTDVTIVEGQEVIVDEIEEVEPEIVEPEIIEPIIPEDQVTTLVFGGDNLIHSAVYRNAKTDDGYDFTPLYENIAPYFRDADIAMINEETVINDLYAPATYPRFSTPIQMADNLIDMGIDIITVANNHVFDVNADGLQNSLEYFRDNTDILTVGAYLNQEEYDDIRLIEENGTTFSFVAATELTNGLSISSSSELVLMLTGNEEEFLSRIAKADEISDVVIVNVHWGYEYHNSPNDMQIDLAQKMTDAGADIIIGHHPHVIQPIEYVTTDAGNTSLVVYSLGNLISAQSEIPRMIGGLVEIEVTTSYSDEITYQASVSNCEFIPIVTHYTSGYNNLVSYPLSMYTDEILATHGLRTSSFTIEYINNYVSNIIDQQFLSIP